MKIPEVLTTLQLVWTETQTLIPVNMRHQSLIPVNMRLQNTHHSMVGGMYHLSDSIMTMFSSQVLTHLDISPVFICSKFQSRRTI